ncbi:ribonuclease P [Halobacteria archaeon AArc-dxtr1]|nr:ribonuclease P [Halobacteria archaeon AArc-dxtr1]
MKHLPKHLRPRWRYLAVGIESWPDADVGRRAFQREVWYAGQNLLGDPGSAHADLSVVRFAFQDGDGEALVKVRRGEEDAARAALACVDEVDGSPVGIAIRGISGTIRAAEEKFLGRREQVPAERNVVFENEERVGLERNGSVDLQRGDAFVGATDLDLV